MTDLEAVLQAEAARLAALPLTVQNLARLSRFCQRASALLAVASDAAALSHEARLDTALMTYGEPYENDLGSSIGMAPVAAVNGSSETFGAKIVREALAAYSSIQAGQRKSIDKVVEAAARAKEAGMTDLAGLLEAEARSMIAPQVLVPVEGG